MTLRTLLVLLLILLTQPLEASHAQSTRPSNGRVMTMAFFGAAAGVAVGTGVSTAGAFAASAICRPRGDGDEPCFSAAALGFATTQALSFAPIVAGGVFFAGRAAGGQGRYGVTLLGASLGMAVHGLVGIVGLRSPEAGIYAVLTSPLGAGLGAMLGYYLSHRSRAGVFDRLAPTVSLEQRGATLGIGGLF